MFSDSGWNSRKFLSSCASFYKQYKCVRLRVKSIFVLKSVLKGLDGNFQKAGRWIPFRVLKKVTAVPVCFRWRWSWGILGSWWFPVTEPTQRGSWITPPSSASTRSEQQKTPSLHPVRSWQSLSDRSVTFPSSPFHSESGSESFPHV